MKLILIFCFALASAGWAMAATSSRRKPSLRQLDVGAMLWAIREVESGDCAGAIGKRGERSAYQFMPSTWSEYTCAPFLMASSDAAAVHRVARLHLAHIREQLARLGLANDPTMIAAAWRFGAGRAVNNCRADSAQRTANLYWDRIGK